MSKNLIFRTIALAIPLVFFVILECGLRVLGVAAPEPLFIENPQAPRYLLPRPDAITRYFPDRSLAPNVSIEANFFLKEKPEKGLRVFVQGGSTAAGFPFGLGASLAGMLDYRLKQTLPDQPVEVINTALSAVNSYTLLDFSEAILEHKPDAVLIYAGHNEYLGIFGVGSNFGYGSSARITRIQRSLMNLRLYRVLQSWLAPINTAAPVRDSRTMMAKVAKRADIAYDSALYNAGVDQFSHNLGKLLKRYQRAGVPVFIGLVQSNLRDQPPFASVKLSADAEVQWQTLSAEIAEPSFDTAKALRDFGKQHFHADAMFKAGRMFVQLEKNSEGLEALRAARDYDVLRFRAPSAFNEKIRALAKRYNAKVVDVAGRLANASLAGVTGSEMMLEHVHPTIEGYFLLSDSFYEALISDKNLVENPRFISSEHALRERPIFDAELYWGRAKIADLLADYPFSEDKKAPMYPPVENWSDRLGQQAHRRQATWLTIANTSVSKSPVGSVERAKGLKLIAEALPHDAGAAYDTGVALIQAERAVEAPRYLKRALAADPNHINAMLALCHALILQQRAGECAPLVNRTLELQPANAMAKEIAEKFGFRKQK